MGPEQAIERLAAICREGPPAASVEQVEVEEAEPEPLADFSKRPTA